MTGPSEFSEGGKIVIFSRFTYIQKRGQLFSHMMHCSPVGLVMQENNCLVAKLSRNEYMIIRCYVQLANRGRGVDDHKVFFSG